MKKQNAIYTIVFMFLAFSGGLKAQVIMEIVEQEKKHKKGYLPGYYSLQYAGNIGFMSIGLGYEWWHKNAQSAFMYGYVPYSHGNATIHTFTIKNTFKLYQFNVGDKYNLIPTMGFSLSLEPGENSYMDVPEKFPEGYYGPNSFYACINLGVKTNIKLSPERHFTAVEFYFEFNTLADYIYYNIIAKEDRSDNIGSLALGANVFF